MKKKSAKFFWLALLLLLAATLFASKAFFHKGFYTSHDGEHQIIRLYRFHKLLNEGQIPVRWAGELRNGYGYPLFIFSYRLPWYFGEIFLRLGFSLVNTVKALFVVAILLSALFMFLWQVELWGIWGGLLASLIYVWAPYRFSVNLVRAALGEAFAIAFAPLLFYSLWQIFKNHKKKRIFILVGALAFWAMLLSHAITTFLYLPAVCIYFLILFLSSEKKKKAGFLKHVLSLFGLGLGLSAFYFIPAFQGKRLISALNPVFFKDHFVTFRQLIYSPWGYTFSMPGIEQDGMSFQVGIIQWLMVVCASGLCLAWFLLNKKLRSKWKIKNVSLVIFCLLLFAISIFLMTEPSGFLWQKISQLFIIDYPWRLISVSLLTASILAGFIWQFTRRLNKILSLVFFFGVLGVAFYTNRNHIKVNKYSFFPENFYTENVGTSNSYDEYTPKWANGNYLKEKRDLLEFKSGKGSIEQLERLSAASVKANFNVSSDKADLDFNQIYYPGWQLFLNGEKIDFNYKDNHGVMRFTAKQGGHKFKAVFKETRLHLFADIISMGSWILLIYIGTLWLRKTK